MQLRQILNPLEIVTDVTAYWSLPCTFLLILAHAIDRHYHITHRVLLHGQLVARAANSFCSFWQKGEHVANPAPVDANPKPKTRL